MIQFPGRVALIKKVYDSGNGSLFENWDSMSEQERGKLIDDISDVDFNLIKKLFATKESAADDNFKPAPFIPLPSSDTARKERKAAEEAGSGHISAGRTAAFIVAGGQGSRLGYEGPKGKFPVGPVSDSTLFQIHGEKILKYSRKYGVSIPWLVMTSRGNHEETAAYFKEQRWFGLDEKDVMIFPQSMIPSLDMEGRLILQDKTGLFKNPDGHGGSLTALASSGALKMLAERGIETISYFQVDNPLVKIIDPVFIGYHVLKGADVSSKALQKAYAGEKIGVFVQFSSGRIGVVEYSDLPENKASIQNSDGRLMFSAGSIAIHLFSRKFIESITSGSGAELPFHLAKKKIKAYKSAEIKEIEGIKYEKFVFDALPLTEKNIVFETRREEEFAPVKNPSGVDSVDSARELMINLHRGWLKQKGVTIPSGVKKIEISPLMAVAPDDLPDNILLSDAENIYLK
jgi:UDP-N-acetylglucosamine/UDP-N-acetylgalactosamine diphosphorylase